MSLRAAGPERAAAPSRRRSSVGRPARQTSRWPSSPPALQSPTRLGAGAGHASHSTCTDPTDAWLLSRCGAHRPGSAVGAGCWACCAGDRRAPRAVCDDAARSQCIHAMTARAEPAHASRVRRDASRRQATLDEATVRATRPVPPLYGLRGSMSVRPAGLRCCRRPALARSRWAVFVDSAGPSVLEARRPARHGPRRGVRRAHQGRQLTWTGDLPPTVRLQSGVSGLTVVQPAGQNNGMGTTGSVANLARRFTARLRRWPGGSSAVGRLSKLTGRRRVGLHGRAAMARRGRSSAWAAVRSTRPSRCVSAASSTSRTAAARFHEALAHGAGRRRCDSG